LLLKHLGIKPRLVGVTLAVVDCLNNDRMGYLCMQQLGRLSQLDSRMVVLFHNLKELSLLLGMVCLQTLHSFLNAVFFLYFLKPFMIDFFWMQVGLIDF
ncbi:hypothetical protein MKW94_006889, partial [Papaver nudicaule]|nr:hypothetical protein [Papaver nudicaule]